MPVMFTFVSQPVLYFLQSLTSNLVTPKAHQWEGWLTDVHVI